jgi:N-acetylneuraminic acid mutarotase
MPMFKRRTLFLAAVAAIPPLTACDRAVRPAETNPQISLLVVSGNQQSGAAGSQLAQALIVKVTKANGVAVKGAVVNFRVTAGGGSVYAGAAQTDDRGIAQEIWTLGIRAGEPQRVEVRAVNAQGEALNYGTFTATAVPGPAARISMVRGDNQTVPPSTAVEIAPMVRVTDQFGNPSAGVAVSFTSSFGSASPAVVNTDARGLAATTWSAPFFSNNGIELTAQASGTGITGNPVVFNAFVAECGCWSFETSFPIATADLATIGVDGKLYALGGVRGNFALAMNQMYDPLTASWVAKATMPTARRSPAAAEVDGIIYVSGGINEQGRASLSSMDAYDPATDIWTPSAPMAVELQQHISAGIDGLVYVVGGLNMSNFQLNTRLEAYDPATNSWSSKAPLPSGRRWAAGAAVGGKLYVVGGYDENFEVTRTVQVYDPASNTWSSDTMPGRRVLAAAASAFGKLYVMGGQDENGTTTNSLFIYDPARRSWSTHFGMPTARYDFGAAFAGGSIFAVAGLNFSAPFSGFIDKVESFLP